MYSVLPVKIVLDAALNEYVDPSYVTCPPETSLSDASNVITFVDLRMIFPLNDCPLTAAGVVHTIHESVVVPTAPAWAVYAVKAVPLRVNDVVMLVVSATAEYGRPTLTADTVVFHVSVTVSPTPVPIVAVVACVVVGRRRCDCVALLMDRPVTTPAETAVTLRLTRTFPGPLPVPMTLTVSFSAYPVPPETIATVAGVVAALPVPVPSPRLMTRPNRLN